MKMVGNAVEAAILEEFREIEHQGGVIGAVERRYQRSQIQASGHLLERQIGDGTRPVIGLNRYQNPSGDWPEVHMIRTPKEKKQLQLDLVARVREATRGRKRALSRPVIKCRSARRKRVRGADLHGRALFTRSDHGEIMRSGWEIPANGLGLKVDQRPRKLRSGLERNRNSTSASVSGNVMKKIIVTLAAVFAVASLFQTKAQAGIFIGLPLPVPLPAFYGPAYYPGGYYYGPYGYAYYRRPYWHHRAWVHGHWRYY